MTRFAFAFLAFIPIFGLAVRCPSNVNCKSTLDRHSCPKGTYYRDGTKSNSCCPSCMPLKDLGMLCREDSDCIPGLSCREIIQGSQGTKNAFKYCVNDEKQSCNYYKNTDKIWLETQYWQPDCLPDGTYAPKQCKGERLTGKCFCMEGNGRRIFGEKPWLEAVNMTCECSRLVANISKTRKDVSLHCDDRGNFEELQCDDGVCWCSNERTGRPYTIIVPENMMRILPCFDEASIGSQYLRQCDSMKVHAERAIKLLKDHGTENIVLSIVNCNYDGSFARVQMLGARKNCMYKNGLNITYATPATKDCNCAYDKFVANNIEGKDFLFECDNHGSYEPKQSLGNKEFHVDVDGFPHSFKDLSATSQASEVDRNNNEKLNA